MRNPLHVPLTMIDAVVGLAGVAARLPELVSRFERRVRQAQADIAAMRVSLEELSDVRRGVEPLDGQLREVERQLVAVRKAVSPLEKRLVGVERSMRSIGELQKQTNEGIGALVKGVDPLEGGIQKTSDNTANVGDQMAILRDLMSGVQAELASMSAAMEPVGNAAERFERLRERLPGVPRSQ